MLITYKSRMLMKICTQASVAEKEYGTRMAEKIHQRVDELSAADSVEMMVKFHIGRCHALSGNRKRQFALDLVHPYRLIFAKRGEEISLVEIQEIVDYH